MSGILMVSVAYCVSRKKIVTVMKGNGEEAARV